MYSDPALIRKHFVKLSLSDREAALIDAFCAYSGEQKATFLRDLILRKAEEVFHNEESGLSLPQMRRTSSGLVSG